MLARVPFVHASAYSGSSWPGFPGNVDTGSSARARLRYKAESVVAGKVVGGKRGIIGITAGAMNSKFTHGAAATAAGINSRHDQEIK